MDWTLVSHEARGKGGAAATVLPQFQAWCPYRAFLLLMPFPPLILGGLYA